jgi:hypothetical protein
MGAKINRQGRYITFQLAGLLLANSARRRGEIATLTAGSGPDSPSIAILATLPKAASGHPGNLG